MPHTQVQTTLLPYSQIYSPMPKMNISIYRKIETVREEVRAKNQKARWGVMDYRINGEKICAVGVDLELEYWRQSTAVGEVVLEGEVVWFSDPTDADRYQDEFLPSIAERMKIQSFVKPFDDLYELLAYAKNGKPVSLEAVVPINFRDFFYSDEGDELSEAGVTLWMMLRSGCAGRVFYFAEENSFGFEYETDAVLLAAYLTDGEHKYGEEAPASAPAQKQAVKKRKKAVDEEAMKKAQWEYMQKMAEIMEEQNKHRHWYRPMWGVDPGNLSDFDLTSITIGDAYNPDDGATSTVIPSRPSLPKRLPSINDRPWPSDRNNLRDYVRTDPRLLRRSAAATLRASLSSGSTPSAFFGTTDLDGEEKVA